HYTTLFRSIRSATTATDFEELNENVPEKLPGPLNGSSFRKRAIWLLAGTVVEPEETVCPPSSRNEKETTAASALGLAIAMPLRTEAFVSASRIPCIINFEAETAASETTTPLWR